MPDTEPSLPYEQYGHEFSHAEWMQLMIHYYRGEMHRAMAWRQRLDVTTNWAVAATAGMLTFVLGSAAVPDEAILLSVALALIMLHIEARRYLYYDLWRSRLRVLERGLIAPALWRDEAQRELAHEPQWRQVLARDLHRARFHMPYSEAFGRRLRRNYIWLLLLNYLAWLLKLGIWPHPADSCSSLLAHARAGACPGSLVVAAVTTLLAITIGLSLFLTRRRHARGEAERYSPDGEADRWGIV